MRSQVWGKGRHIMARCHRAASLHPRIPRASRDVAASGEILKITRSSTQTLSRVGVRRLLLCGETSALGPDIAPRRDAKGNPVVLPGSLVIGGSGDDVLIGNSGNDTLVGGTPANPVPGVVDEVLVRRRSRQPMFVGIVLQRCAALAYRPGLAARTYSASACSIGLQTIRRRGMDAHRGQGRCPNCRSSPHVFTATLGRQVANREHAR